MRYLVLVGSSEFVGKGSGIGVEDADMLLMEIGEGRYYTYFKL